MLEVAHTQPQPFRSVAGSYESPLLAQTSLQGPGLSRSYGLGIFRGDKGIVEFNRKTRTLAVEQNGVPVRAAIADLGGNLEAQGYLEAFLQQWRL